PPVKIKTTYFKIKSGNGSPFNMSLSHNSNPYWDFGIMKKAKAKLLITSLGRPDYMKPKQIRLST
ncbi:MAG: hypothetical protein ACK5TU_06735, partial [Cyclobacteriaceae bacterium]